MDRKKLKNRRISTQFQPDESSFSIFELRTERLNETQGFSVKKGPS